MMKSPKKYMLISVMAAAILVVLGTAALYLNSRLGPWNKKDTITIGTAPLESSALVYVALHKGFFTRNGLIVTIRNYQTGADSVTGLLKKEVDLAIPAEYALAGKAFQKADVRAIASIAKAQYFSLIGRGDRGIRTVFDLKGKRIGVVRKTIAEFYLGRFLELHGISVDQVVMVPVDYVRSEEVTTKGGVDAIVSRPPYTDAIEKQLGKNAVIWPLQSGQALYAVMTARHDWLRDHLTPVKGLLDALVLAEEVMIRNPAEAKGIVRQRLGLDDAYMAAVWSQNQFSLSLDQSLITAMEDEARWMIKNNLTAAKKVPDFLEHIHEGALQSVKPETVNIIR